MTGDGLASARGPAPSRPSPLGPGTLVLVVGPSGAGKDTVIAAARDCLAGEARVLFARRRVTRPQGAGEQHGTLTEDAFAAALAAERFPLAWRAHGLGYALGPEVAEAVAAGLVVVANGSRATLPKARQRFACLKVVLVSAPAAVRATRLKARGRERHGEIAERLARDPAVGVTPDLVIDNVGPPEAAGRRLADFIRGALGPEPPR